MEVEGEILRGKEANTGEGKIQGASCTNHPAVEEEVLHSM